MTLIPEGYDRVTACLYPFSGMSTINASILANAGHRGTLVHQICDCIINGIGYENAIEDLKMIYGGEGYIESFKQWYNDQKFMDLPRRFFCNELMITGEIDGLYKNETGFTLVDFKTPLKESITWKLQGSAYNYLCLKSGINITKIEFIRLKKDGKSPQTYEYTPDFETYKKCLDLYRLFFKAPQVCEELDYL